MAGGPRSRVAGIEFVEQSASPAASGIPVLYVDDSTHALKFKDSNGTTGGVGTITAVNSGGGVTASTVAGVVTLGSSGGGDVSGSLSALTVAKINGASLGTTTASSGNVLVGSGSAWVTKAISGDATLASTGALTVTAIQGKTADVLAAKGDVYVFNGTALKLLGVGSNNQVLTADSTATLGVKWADPAGGIADPGSNGILARTALNTVSARTITAGTGISVSNGSGASGNPTIANDGVTSLTGGGGVSVSGSTGAITFSTSGGGDVSGSLSALSVNAIHGNAAASTAPTVGHVLSWQSVAGSPAWVTTALGGDISGDATAVTVGKIQGYSVDAPTTKGDVFVFNGTAIKRLAAGADGTVLTTDSAQATGLKWSSPLSYIADPGSNGIAVRTALNTLTARSIAAPAAGISISNGDGVSGNPTLALANDLSALEGLSSTGFAVRTASDTWAQRSITVSTPIAISNGDGVSGNPALSLNVGTGLATSGGNLVPDFGTGTGKVVQGLGSSPAGTYGNSTKTVTLTVNAAGQITSATENTVNTLPSGTAGQILYNNGTNWTGLNPPAADSARYQLTAINTGTPTLAWMFLVAVVSFFAPDILTTYGATDSNQLVPDQEWVNTTTYASSGIYYGPLFDGTVVSGY